MRAHERVDFVVDGTNAGTLELEGGTYLLLTLATGTGTIDLEVLGPDGATFIPVATQITATSGHQVLQLPPGQYKAVIATFTASYVSVTRIPGD